MKDRNVVQLRNLERHLFSAWCQWLCYPSRSQREERRNKEEFVKVASIVDQVLGEETGSPFFLDKFSIVDCVFIPYVERMNASLFYYKGFNLRDSKLFPNLCSGFRNREKATYRGTQSDFHTHAHDLPLKWVDVMKVRQTSSNLQERKSMKDHGLTYMIHF